jgi:hypothetical protein
MTNEEIFTATALTSWNQWMGRADKFVDSLPDEKFFLEVAPGKNRVIYIVGHLIAVNDAMIPQLRLGEASHPELRETFITQPDRAVADLPAPAELRRIWKDVHTRLDRSFKELTPAQWLERHSSVSEEDFAKEPHRNRLAIVVSRTAHVGYHAGQLLLLPK